MPPSAETVQDESYTPLGRQLFIYLSKAALDRPEVEAFVSFYVENIDVIAEAAQFIGLNDEQKTTLQSVRCPARMIPHGSRRFGSEPLTHGGASGS